MVQWHSSEAISQKIPQPPITKIISKITYLNFIQVFSGANELIQNECIASEGEVSNRMPGQVLVKSRSREIRYYSGRILDTSKP